MIKAVGGTVEGKRTAVLGLTFKPKTDDMRDALSLEITPALQRARASVSAYDPQGVRTEGMSPSHASRDVRYTRRVRIRRRTAGNDPKDRRECPFALAWAVLLPIFVNVLSPVPDEPLPGQANVPRSRRPPQANPRPIPVRVAPAPTDHLSRAGHVRSSGVGRRPEAVTSCRDPS